MDEIRLNKRLLMSQLILRGLSCADFADAQGWSMTTVYRKLNGKAAFTAPEIQVCIERLNLDSETANAIFFATEVS